MLDLATATPTAQLHSVELCYRYAYLEGRRAANRRLDQTEVNELAKLRRLLQGDDPVGDHHTRRGCRRFPLLVRAVAKTKEGWGAGLVLNISGDGMYFLSTRRLAVGERIQVKLGRLGEVEYIFTCTVRWIERHQALAGVGVSFCCVPLEMRRACSAA